MVAPASARSQEGARLIADHFRVINDTRAIVHVISNPGVLNAIVLPALIQPLVCYLRYGLSDLLLSAERGSRYVFLENTFRMMTAVAGSLAGPPFLFHLKEFYPRADIFILLPCVQLQRSRTIPSRYS